MSQLPPQVTYATAPPRGMSLASLVLGLVSIFFGFTFVVPIVGLILGMVGIKREPAGRGMAIAGIIINAVVLAGVALLLLLLIGGLLTIPFFVS